MADYIERENLRNKIAYLQNQRKSHGHHLLAEALDIVLLVIDKAPAADVAPVVKDLRPAVRLLHKEYERAKKNPVVRNPLAYALYQVWKAVDDCENGR